MKKVLIASIIAALSAPVLAGEQTVTLSVPGMTCAACPITVKKALQNVPGVQKAEVSYERKEALVTFDDTKTSLDALTNATADVGYPSAINR